MSVEVVVEHEYEAQQDDELTLRIGEIITNVVKQPGGWWEGVLGGKKGMFPDNFVKEVKRSKSPPTKKIDDISSKPSNSSVSQLASQLANQGLLRVGQPPANNSSEEPLPLDGMPVDLRGSKRMKGLVGGRGVFDPTPIPPSSSTVPALPQKEVGREKAKVLFSYKAENQDELELEVGDIIVVLEKELEDVGWWKGELRGKVGVFPDNFVELIPFEKSDIISSAVVGGHRSKNHERPPAPTPSVPDQLKLDHASNKHSKSEDHSAKPSWTGPTAGARPLPTGAANNVIKKPQAPPPEGKQPITIPPSQTDDQKSQEISKEGNQGTLDRMSVEARLNHITANRARAPQRRPPKQGNRDHSQELDSRDVVEDEAISTSMSVAPRTDQKNGEVITASPSSAPNSALAANKLKTTDAPERPPPERPAPPVISAVREQAARFKDSNSHPSPAPSASSSRSSIYKLHAGPTPALSAIQRRDEDEHTDIIRGTHHSPSPPGDAAPIFTREMYEELRTEVSRLRAELERLRAKHEREVNELVKEMADERRDVKGLLEEFEKLKKLTRTRYGAVS